MEEVLNIVEILRAHRKEILRFGVKRCGVFGSASRGELTPGSDVDLFVEFHDPTFDNFMDLEFYLEDLLGRKVELVCPESLRPSLRRKIEAELLDVA
ncbi:MAG: hypothetical protein D6679_11290 [Candidatus Hydrogenedentota bacterium]|nr:MAG: hypothetical protein D6679_11290 [Candidatus Hydrogenedentota bacterium]